MLRAVAATVLAVLLAGCGGYTPVVPPEASPDPALGYIYGRFTTNSQYHRSPIRVGVILARVGGEEDYAFECRTDNTPEAIAVPPGTYRIRGMGGRTPENLLGEVTLKPGPLTQPFTVEAGKAAYIGDYNLGTWGEPGNGSSSWRLSAVDDNFDTTTSDFLRARPAFGRVPVVRALDDLDKVVCD